MRQTLLLSQSYEPVATISWQRAICLWTLGKVEVVAEYDRVVRSMRLAIGMPSIVRLVHRFRRRRRPVVAFSRRNVMIRDRYRCQYCGQRRASRELTYDHVVPKAQGGRTTWDNIVLACVSCNSRKANRTPQEAGMRLRRGPVRPSWSPMYLVEIPWDAMPEPWRDYCYWTVELLD